MKENTIVIDNLELFYTDNQNQGLPVIFLHGNSLGQALFENQLKSNTLNQYRLISIDMPGHGKSCKSSNPEKEYSVANYINLVKKFIHQLALKEVVLFGHSLGGHMAIHIANEIEGVEIKGLIIQGTPPLTIPPKLEEAFLPNPAMALAFKPDLNEQEKQMLAGAYGLQNGKPNTPIIELLEASDPLVRPLIGQSIGRDLINDEADILRKANYPICIIHGEKDPLVNVEYIKNLGLKLWNNQIQLINAGHSSTFEEPEAYNKLINSFLSNT